MVPLLLTFLSLLTYSNAEGNFDVRKHLSTATRYAAVKNDWNDTYVPFDVPQECVPIHLNLVARHGTRAPTKKRIRDLNRLSAHLEAIIRDAKQQNLSLETIPSWLHGWKSPWRAGVKGGELLIKGEEELYDLGLRTRETFPDLFDEEYQPEMYHIKATQIPRASASAVAFAMGIFSDYGTLGRGHHRSFSVTTESRGIDILLRFYDSCDNYKDFKKQEQPAVDKLQEPVLDVITSALVARFGLNFTMNDTSSLWFLCKQEASLLDITNQACSLFTPSEIIWLEWTDDLALRILKGYGKSVNYRMGVPLLEDVLRSMERVIKAKEEGQSPGSYEKARLRFAHAETVVPFTCLLGLFLEQSEFEQIQREEPLDHPPKPPHKRKWRGSKVVPFASNNMLVLYSCSTSNKSTGKYFVQVLHNEHPVTMPGCNGSHFCPFEVFKEKIVEPHRKHDYDAVCNTRTAQTSGVSKFSQWSEWLLSFGKAIDT